MRTSDIEKVVKMGSKNRYFQKVFLNDKMKFLMSKSGGLACIFINFGDFGEVVKRVRKVIDKGI